MLDAWKAEHTSGPYSQRHFPSGTIESAPARCRCIHLPFTWVHIIGRMPLRALLMRLFLIVALLANGPGIAGASMHMTEHLSNSPGDAAHVTATQTAADCHGAGVIAPVTDDHHHPQAADHTGTAPPLGDCCETGNCGACMHHCCSAAIAGSALADFTTRYRHTAEPFLSVHASAALTNLFRPPIG